MHLCVDVRMYRASGIGTYLQNLLPRLADFQITLLGDTEDLAQYPGPKIHSRLPIYSISELARLHSLIPPCDVFWSPHYNVPPLPIRAARRLVTIHDVYHLAYYRTLSRKQKLYAKLMMRAATRLSDQIITVSEFSRGEISKYTGVDPSKIAVIPNGINHQQFHPDYELPEQERVRKKYRLPPRFILYVGNVKPHKNLSCLVKAYQQSAEKIPHQLVIVGKQEGFITSDSLLPGEIESSTTLRNNIIFTGFAADEDLPLIYSMADLFVFPSLYEGFGLPPLEAMACGCLTLTSQRASMPEMCGSATTYFDPEDPADLARKISELLSMGQSDRQKRISLGLERASDYTWTSSADQHRSVVRNLV